jgi:hypothetical protein
MKNIIENIMTIKGSAILMGSVFLFSLMIFFIKGPEKKRVLLLFPEDDLTTLSGDYHIIPRKTHKKDFMRVLLEEALLEPYDYHLNEIVPEGVKVKSFIYDKEKGVLFVDFSLQMVLPEDDHPQRVDPDRMLEMLEENLRFNFPELKEVKFTVDGQVPHSYVFNETMN